MNRKFGRETEMEKEIMEFYRKNVGGSDSDSDGDEVGCKDGDRDEVGESKDDKVSSARGSDRSGLKTERQGWEEQDRDGGAREEQEGNGDRDESGEEGKGYGGSGVLSAVSGFAQNLFRGSLSAVSGLLGQDDSSDSGDASVDQDLVQDGENAD
ncbi:hypothetical protein B484DRAFT_459813 [Ochromonadaceae sp. CCMP2298]|nr:hypothetical protein B484DRAFT_459813 [Ochromonadaceae sp. CCMP2298]